MKVLIVIAVILAVTYAQMPDLFGGPGGEKDSRCLKECKKGLKRAIRNATEIRDATQPTLLVEAYSKEKFEKLCQVYKEQTTSDGNCFSKCDGFIDATSTPSLAAYQWICVDGAEAIAANTQCFAKASDAQEAGAENCKGKCAGVMIAALFASGSKGGGSSGGGGGGANPMMSMMMGGGPPKSRGGPPNLGGMMGMVGGMCKAISCMVDCGETRVKAQCTEGDEQQKALDVMQDFINVTTTAELGPLFQLTALGVRVPPSCRKLRGEEVSDEELQGLTSQSNDPKMSAELQKQQMKVFKKQLGVLTKQDAKLELEMNKLNLEMTLLKKKQAQA